LSCNDLQFLTPFGTPIANQFGMHTEMNRPEGKAPLPASPVSPAGIYAASLEESEWEALRLRLHELANVFTGVIIAGGLLCNRLQGEDLGRYAADICEGSERGCELVSELRSRLATACGEPVLARGRRASSLECAGDSPGAAGSSISDRSAARLAASPRPKKLNYSNDGGER